MRRRYESTAFPLPTRLSRRRLGDLLDLSLDAFYRRIPHCFGVAAFGLVATHLVDRLALPASGQASEFSVECVLKPEASFSPGSDRRRPCATCILLLKLLQAPHLRRQRAVVLFLPDEVDCLADADLADVSHRHAVAALLPTPSERPNISMLSSLSALPSQKIDAEDSTLAGLRVPRGRRLGALCG